MHTLHSIRLAYENWFYEERFNELLTLLKKHPCGIDQLSLFTSFVHIPLKLDEVERRTAVIKTRMEQARKEGWSAGINILATIGHHCENLDDLPEGDWRHMTNIHGEVGMGTYCMNDERYIQEHVVPTYRLLAQANPDYIWIDDDIRYGHMPIGNGCYCDGCIELFNRNNGFSFTRETLKDALNNDIAVRKQYLRQQSNAISHLFSVIEETVHAISPNIKLGFMTGERYAEGYAFHEFSEALSAHGKYEIMWRPGGGAYNDFRFDDIVEKAEQIGRQNAYLPEYVTINQSEIENFPYQLTRKTPTSTAAEATLHMISGCTGAAYNILPSESMEPVSTIEPLLITLDRFVPFHRLIQEKLANTRIEGIHTGWRINSQAAAPIGKYFQFYGGQYADFARELIALGLPECYHKDAAQMTLLSGTAASVMDDEEITRIFSGGVYMDAGALSYLNSRGFGRYTGFEVERAIPVDAREVYSNDSLNEGLAGGIRNCRQAFNPGDSFALRPTQKNARTLAGLIDYQNVQTAECCMGAYENELGGRIAVGGYYPFAWISDWQKSIQLKRLMVWLSGDTLSAWSESYARLRVIAHNGADKRLVSVFNPTNEALENVKIALRTDKTSAALYTQFAPDAPEKIHLAILPEFSGCRLVVLPQLPPYEHVLIEL